MHPPAKSCRYNVSGFVEELPQLPENREGHACAALSATGVRLAQPTFFISGTCCCWRKGWWWKLPFFCADSHPWSNSMDSPCLPPTWIMGGSSFDCGRTAQGEWGSGWSRFLQIWGDEWKVQVADQNYVFEIVILILIIISIWNMYDIDKNWPLTIMINDQVGFSFVCQVLEYHAQPWNQWVKVANLEKETGTLLHCLSDESNEN